MYHFISARSSVHWNPNVNGGILSIRLRGSLAYIGGEFTDVSGLPQAGIAALDTTPKRQLFLPLLYRQ